MDFGLLLPTRNTRSFFRTTRKEARWEKLDEYAGLARHTWLLRPRCCRRNDHRIRVFRRRVLQVRTRSSSIRRCVPPRYAQEQGPKYSPRQLDNACASQRARLRRLLPPLGIWPRRLRTVSMRQSANCSPRRGSRACAVRTWVQISPIPTKERHDRLLAVCENAG